MWENENKSSTWLLSDKKAEEKELITIITQQLKIQVKYMACKKLISNMGKNK